jgi:hypothetical protein
MTEGEPGAATSTSRKAGIFKKLLWLSLLVVSVSFLGVTMLVMRSKPSGPLAQMELADGRVLQIEGVTYGTDHRMGHHSIIFERFGPWLPQHLRDRLQPRTPENTIELERPGLVVWVNAIDPDSGTNVDCQGIRTEFVDKYGDLFGTETSHWFGGQSFYRVGHVFYSYPRAEGELTFRVTPWKKDKNRPVTAQIPNPHVERGVAWSGKPPPQTNFTGPLEIILAGLNARTNEAKYWQTPSTYFEPVWELRQNGMPAHGWSEPEWFAEDSTGNRGQYLGQHQSVLRFSVMVHPLATNTAAIASVVALPRVDLGILTNQTVWNSKLLIGTNEIAALGVCPAGTYTFAGGNFDPTGPPMGAVRGGAGSGWVSQTSRVTPMKLQVKRSHYTPNPTIYIRAAKLGDMDRLAVRLRDDFGRWWVAKPESQGNPEGVHAFLIELPTEVTWAVPELVLLKPVQAEFLVKTPASP